MREKQKIEIELDPKTFELLKLFCEKNGIIKKRKIVKFDINLNNYWKRCKKSE